MYRIGGVIALGVHGRPATACASRCVEVRLPWCGLSRDRRLFLLISPIKVAKVAKVIYHAYRTVIGLVMSIPLRQRDWKTGEWQMEVHNGDGDGAYMAIQ